MTVIQKIRQKIIDRDYFYSTHAEDEMLEDFLERDDVVNAILKGQITKKFTRDPRGTRYLIEGPAKDGRLMNIILRFKEDGNLVIITVYL